MPKATTSVTLSKTSWTKIADSGQKFFFTVMSGHVLMHYAASDPGAAVKTGHALQEGDTFGDDTDNNVWARVREVGISSASPDTVIALTK